MRRALRWLWRQCWKIALVGLMLISGSLLVFASTPPLNQPITPIHTMTMTQSDGMAASASNHERAKERARRARILYIVSFLYEGALLAGFFALGGSRWLSHLVTRFDGRWILALVAVVGIISIAGSLLTFPLDYYSSFVFEHQYGLSNQTTWQWLHDYFLNGFIGLIIGLPVAIMAYAILRRAPKTWWIWLTAASVPLSILMMLIAPVFIAPLFNKFTPLKDQTLRHEILAMAHQQGIHTDDVYQVDASRQSNAVNAYVNGFGPTQRIVLYDTLIKNFTHQEIEFVMAHEMGHYVLGHIRQGIMFSILGTLIGSFVLYRAITYTLTNFGNNLGYEKIGNPASYPLLLAMGMIVSLIALPIGNAFSRHLEWQADRFAIQIYPHPEVGIAAFRKLATYNVAEENPPRWAEILWGSHPSLAERIHALEEVKEGKPFPKTP